MSQNLSSDDAAMLACVAYVASLVLMNDEPAKALREFEYFDDWAAQQLGTEHPYVAQSMVRQAWCHAQLGDQERACALYRRLLGVLAQRLGREHSTYATVAGYVQIACGEGGDPGDAATPPRYLPSVPVFNPLAGGVSRVTVWADEGRLRELLFARGIPWPTAAMNGAPGDELLYHLGLVMEEFGEFEIASQMFEDYQRWASEHNGPDHDYVRQSISHRAYCRLRAGDYVESCRLYQVEFEMLRRTHPEHAQIELRAKQIRERCPPCDPQWWFALGCRWAAFKRPQDAIAAFEAYERWASSHYGDGHPYVVHALFQRAHCHKDMGHVGQACRLFSKVLELADEDTWTPVGPDGTYENFDMATVAQACIDEYGAVAASPLDQAWDLHETWVPLSMALIEPELRDIGYTLTANQHWDEALSAFEGSEAWVVRTHGPDKLRSDALAGQAACWVALGDESRARDLYQEALRFVPEEGAAADNIRAGIEELGESEP